MFCEGYQRKHGVDDFSLNRLVFGYPDEEFSRIHPST